MTAKTMKLTGRARSIPAGIAMASAASMITTAVLCAILANALNCEKLTWEQAGYWIMGMLYLASLIGAKIAIAAVKRQRIAISIMSGVLYWSLLLCVTALLFGGQFDAVWVTFGIIAAGSATAALVTVSSRKRNGRQPGRGHR